MLIDNLKLLFARSLPNWVNKGSVLLSWLKATLEDLADIAENYTTEADVMSGSVKANSNWLENQSIYIGASNIPSHDTESNITTLLKRGTARGFVEMAYYLDADHGSFDTSVPSYTISQTADSITWSGTHADIIIYKTTLNTISNHFWIADKTSPGDAAIQHNVGGTLQADYVGPSVSHILVKIKRNYINQSSEDTKLFISKHFIPAGLPVIFI